MNDLDLKACRYRRQFDVPFRDVDLFAHVNNVAYMHWCEDIRIRYFEDVIGQPVDNGSLGMIIVRMEYHYLAQVYFKDEISIGCRTSRLGKKSFDFRYEVWNQTRSERAGWGVSILVAYDYAAKHSIAVPSHWRERITAYETVKPEELTPLP